MKFSNCNYEVNYTDTIVRDVLARGIADPDIQLDPLEENKTIALDHHLHDHLSDT